MRVSLSNFEEKIDDQVCTRGRQYWQSSLVRELRDKGRGVWQASVTGRSLYDVSLTLSGDEIEGYSYTCPYVLGSFCKHLAAVAFALRERLRNGSAVDTPLAALYSRLNNGLISQS